MTSEKRRRQTRSPIFSLSGKKCYGKSMKSVQRSAFSGMSHYPPIPPLPRGGAGGVNILDLCTGSGCIALALAKHFSSSTVIGTDRSEAAMVYATQNAKENGIGNVRFKLGDLFEPVSGMAFDCIVSNPPYVRRGEIRTLQREVKDYEPLEALDGGKDGLDFYRRILKDAPRYLKKGGTVLLEIGYDQAEEVREIAARNGFANISFIKDYAGIKRIFVGIS